VVLAVGVVVLKPEREPEYGGKKLSEWVDCYRGGQVINVNSLRDSRDSDDAISQIGTNAVPFLLNWIRYETPLWKSQGYRVINAILNKLGQSREITDERQKLRAQGAVMALRALGADADMAIGELAKLLTNPNATVGATRAARVLLGFNTSQPGHWPASLVMVAVIVKPEREPEYGGRNLSDWVQVCARSDVHESREDAGKAFRHIGTNGIPYLLKWIRYETPSWKRKLFAIKNPAVRTLSGRLRRRDFSAAVRAEAAAYVLTTLGTNAEGAVGERGKLLSDGVTTASDGRAVLVLGNIGAAGLPPLILALTNRHSSAWGRSMILHELKQMGTNAGSAIPVLLDALGDADLSVRSQATNALQ